jgi:hypothetical protein
VAFGVKSERSRLPALRPTTPRTKACPWEPRQSEGWGTPHKKEL